MIKIILESLSELLKKKKKKKVKSRQFVSLMAYSSLYGLVNNDTIMSS